MSLVHIKFPRVDWCYVRVLDCPTCQRKRTMWVWGECWYGSELTCLTCGERFGEDGMCGRPFAPRWRATNVLRARKHMVRCIASFGRPPYERPIEQLL